MLVGERIYGLAGGPFEPLSRAVSGRLTKVCYWPLTGRRECVRRYGAAVVIALTDGLLLLRGGALAAGSPGIRVRDGVVTDSRIFEAAIPRLSSFGVDQQGRIYAVGYQTGEIYRAAAEQ